jgi:HAD superfamily hydrolase (TIGR01509 family)
VSAGHPAGHPAGQLGKQLGAPLVEALAGVIFDCDGVLVDSERITSRVWAGLLTEIGLPTTTEQSLATYLGNAMARCLEIVTVGLGHVPPDDLLPRFYAAMKIALEQEVTAVDGIVDLLDALDAAGLPYAVASNGEQAKMQTTLGVTGLAPRFEGRRFSSLDVGRPKPAPDVFLHAASALRIEPARTVVIEDSPLGVEGAVAAGMTVIGYAEIVSAERLLAAGARATVTHLAEVPALLGLSRTPD